VGVTTPGGCSLIPVPLVPSLPVAGSAGWTPCPGSSGSWRPYYLLPTINNVGKLDDGLNESPTVMVG
jgi:hypothetical protein